MAKFPVKEAKSNALQAVALFVIATIIIIIYGFVLIGGRGDIQERELLIFTIYGIIAIFSTFAIVGVNLAQPILREKMSSIWVQIYDFADTQKADLKFKFLKSPLKITLISLSVFGIVFLISGIFNIFFTAIPEAQALGFLADVWFSIEIAGYTEVVMLIIPFSLMWGLIWRLSKFKKDKFAYWTLSIINWSVWAGMFVFFHLLRYGGQEIALWAVFSFAWIGLMLTQLTGSIIVFWVMHDVSNLFNKLNKLFSSNMFLLIAIGIIAVFVIMSVIIIKALNKRDLRKEANIVRLV